MYLATNKIVTMKDQEKMSSTALFSALGGTLNLYSGISCVVIIEVAELLFLLLFSCKDKKKKKEKADEENDLIQKKPEALFEDNILTGKHGTVYTNNYNTQWD